MLCSCSFLPWPFYQLTKTPFPSLFFQRREWIYTWKDGVAGVSNFHPITIIFISPSPFWLFERKEYKNTMIEGIEGRPKRLLPIQSFLSLLFIPLVLLSIPFGRPGRGRDSPCCWTHKESPSYQITIWITNRWSRERALEVTHTREGEHPFPLFITMQSALHIWNGLSPCQWMFSWSCLFKPPEFCRLSEIAHLREIRCDSKCLNKCVVAWQ